MVNIYSWLNINTVQTTDQRIQLYETTEKASPQMRRALAEVFKCFEPSEVKTLSKWIAKNSTKDREGAYTIFCKLFGSSSDIAQQAIAHIDTLTGDLHLLEAASGLSNWDFKSLRALRLISREFREIINRELIHRLNMGMITFRQLRIYSVDGIIKFFGDQCSQFTMLNLESNPCNCFQKVDRSGLEKIIHHFPNTRNLTLNFAKFDDASLFANLKFLTHLSLIQCQEIKDFTPLKNCKNLIYLNLSNNDQVADFSFVEELEKIESLNFEYSGINDISFVKNCENLRSLNLGRCDKLQSLEPLKEAKNLENLSLEGCHQFLELKFLENCKKLVSLNLRAWYHIEDFSDLALCPGLKSLDLQCCTIKNLDFLKKYRKLEILNLQSCVDLHCIEPIKNFTNLKHLDIAGCKLITNLECLKNCKEIEHLYYSNGTIESLSFLQSLTKLKKLSLRYISLLDFSDLKHLNELKELDLYGCEVQDISFLKPLKKLEQLNLSWCPVANWAPLGDCKQIVSLSLMNCENIDFTLFRGFTNLELILTRTSPMIVRRLNSWGIKTYVSTF